jgi:hypothetical protein
LDHDHLNETKLHADRLGALAVLNGDQTLAELASQLDFDADLPANLTPNGWTEWRMWLARAYTAQYSQVFARVRPRGLWWPPFMP